VTSTCTVSGMTSSHRVAAVSEEPTRLPAVRRVRIDLTSGAVTVESGSDLPIDEVGATIDAARCELADAGA
jgi:copper chaperone